MSLTIVGRLLEQAKAGERLDAADRRRCIAQLMQTDPDYTNVELGELFQVNEKTIREDKNKVQDEIAEEIEQDDIKRVVASIKMNFDRQLNDLEKGKKHTKPGSLMHLNYCKAILYMELEKTKAFQNLGILPSNVGAMVTNEYTYVAVVGKGDHVDTRRLEEFDPETQKKIKEARRKALKSAPEVIDVTPERKVLQPVMNENKSA